MLRKGVGRGLALLLMQNNFYQHLFRTLVWPVVNGLDVWFLRHVSDHNGNLWFYIFVPLMLIVNIRLKITLLNTKNFEDLKTYYFSENYGKKKSLYIVLCRNCSMTVHFISMTDVCIPMCAVLQLHLNICVWLTRLEYSLVWDKFRELPGLY